MKNRHLNYPERAFGSRSIVITKVLLWARYLVVGGWPFRSETAGQSPSRRMAGGCRLLAVLICLACVVALGIPVQGQILNGTLTDAVPFETHSVKLADDGRLTLTITTGPDLNLLNGVYILETDGVTQLYHGTQGPGATKEHSVANLRAGEYLVKVWKDGRSFYFGPYTIEAKLEPESRPVDGEPNNLPEQALAFELNQPVTGHMGFVGGPAPLDGTDYWKVRTPTDGQLALEITTGPDLNLLNGVFVYDSDGKTQLAWRTQGPSETKIHVVNQLRAGTYVIALVKDTRTQYYGSYSLTARHAPDGLDNDSEPNDAEAQAQSMLLNTLVTGHLGFLGGGLGTTVDQDDWWVFTLPDSDSVEIELATGADLNLFNGVMVYQDDASKRIYWGSQGSGDSKRHILGDLGSGRYLLRLVKDSRPWYWGSYSLRVKTGKLLPPEVSTGSVKVIGSIQDHGAPSFNIADNHFWTMTTAGFDQVGKIGFGQRQAYPTGRISE